jgi:hypothetical protein
MSAPRERIQPAATWRALLLNADDSELLAHADELLVFLNRLKDILRRSVKAQFPISSFDVIIYRLESDPGATLQDKSVRVRLLNLFMKLQEY